MLLQEFDFNLSVVAGRDNLVADTLSRVYPLDKTKFEVEALNDTDVGCVDFLTFNKSYSHESPTMPHLNLDELRPDVKDEVSKLHNEECMSS